MTLVYPHPGEQDSIYIAEHLLHSENRLNGSPTRRTGFRVEHSHQKCAFERRRAIGIARVHIHVPARLISGATGAQICRLATDSLLNCVDVERVTILIN